MTEKISAHYGQIVVINDKAPYFNGERAVIAYIGDDGVSVYLKDCDFDACICLNYGEFEEEP